MSAPNFMAIHTVVIKLFHSGLVVDEPTLLSTDSESSMEAAAVERHKLNPGKVKVVATMFI